MHPGWERGASASPALPHLDPRDQEPSGVMHVENQPQRGQAQSSLQRRQLGGVSSRGSSQQQGSRICRQPFSSLASAVTKFAPSLRFFESEGVCAHLRIPKPRPRSGTGHKFYPHPRLETCRQAGAPSPQMSLKRFREQLIPSLLNAWKLLTLNLYRHN